MAVSSTVKPSLGKITALLALSTALVAAGGTIERMFPQIGPTALIGALVAWILMSMSSSSVFGLAQHAPLRVFGLLALVSLVFGSGVATNLQRQAFLGQDVAVETALVAVFFAVGLAAYIAPLGDLKIQQALLIFGVVAACDVSHYLVGSSIVSSVIGYGVMLAGAGIAAILANAHKRWSVRALQGKDALSVAAEISFAAMASLLLVTCSLTILAN